MFPAAEPHFHIISSGSRRSLVFVTKAERDAYEKDLDKLVAKHRDIIRKKYGIWAGNQNKFVPTEADLNRWDSRDYL